MDDGDGAVGVGEDVEAGGAGEQLDEASAAAGADDDEVGLARRLDEGEGAGAGGDDRRRSRRRWARSPVPPVARSMARPQQHVVVGDRLVGFQAGFAHRPGGDPGHEVGVRHLDPLEPGQADGPAQRGQRAVVGLLVVVTLVDADDRMPDRRPQLRRARPRPGR